MSAVETLEPDCYLTDGERLVRVILVTAEGIEVEDALRPHPVTTLALDTVSLRWQKVVRHG